MASNRRQELYDRIRQSSKAEVELEEMVRLGFWPREGVLPNDPADELRRTRELKDKLKALRTEETRLKNVEGMLRQVKRQRMVESKQRQKETKERRERERVERAEAWQQKQTEDIVYLGQDVSGGLNERIGYAPQGLPELQTPAAIAQAMKVSINTLRFLTYNRKVSKVSNYIRFEIPKRSGGARLISAPMPTLKYAQEWVLRNILEQVQISDAAHGFCLGKSIVTNAKPHIGADVVVNIDLKDFFPTVTYSRVKGLFQSLGYSESAATIFGLLCTEPEVEEVEMDGQTYFVAVGDRFLPQGAPSSPAITNVICRRLDRKLAKLCASLGFTYTRYADDMTFSSRNESPPDVGRLLRRVRFLVKREGFQINEKKTRILRKGNRQEVTGVVVNEKPNICRKRLKAFRATLYQIEKDGPEGKTWGQSGNVLASIWGYASFVAMVNPTKGIPLQMRVWAILQKHGWTKPELPHRTSHRLPQTVPGAIIADRERARRQQEMRERQAKDEPPPIPPSHAKPSPTTRREPPPVPGAAKDKPWWKFW